MKLGDKYVLRCIETPVGFPESHIISAFKKGDYVAYTDFTEEDEWPAIQSNFIPVKILGNAFIFTCLKDTDEDMMVKINDVLDDVDDENIVASFFMSSFIDCRDDLVLSGAAAFFKVIPVSLVPIVK